MRNIEGAPSEEDSNEFILGDVSPENIDLSEEPMVKAENEREVAEEPDFEENMEAVREQQEEIRIEARERDDRGILTRLSQGGKKFAGIVLLSLSSFAAATAYHNRPGVSEAPKSQGSSKVESISTELPKEKERIIEKKGFEKSHYLAKRDSAKDNQEKDESADADNEDSKIEAEEKSEEPVESAGLIIGSEEDLKEKGKSDSNQKESADNEESEKTNEENMEGFSLRASAPEEQGFETGLAEEYERAHDKEKPIISRQIERRIMENFRYFMKNSKVVSLEDGSFAVDIGINKDSDNRVVFEVPESPCYKVTPEDLSELERIRKEHMKKVNFVLSKRPFLSAEIEKEIRKKTEKSLERAIRYCEEIPGDQLPEEIKKFREEKLKETQERKERIMAQNKENKTNRRMSETEKTVQKLSEPESEESIRKISDPRERLERRIKSIREIRSK